ncbi:MAG TPA: hypothetical protein VKE74_26720, partial [Gemmataceae bacterium]|nr:hypothetical protein [Gemmataceae bacterium]
MTPAAFLTLFAENTRRTEPFLQKAEDWVVVGLLVGTLFAAAGIFWLFERWRKRAMAAPTQDAAEELSNFRVMFERGEITEEEYNKLRQKVADRVKAAPAPATPTGAP